MRRPRWAVMISGRGSNLAALLELRDEIDIRLVVSSSPKAFGLLRARRAGVPTMLAPHLAAPNATFGARSGATSGAKKIDWVKLDEMLRAQGVTHIFLAGFMKVVPGSFVELWRGRIVNLHPSLLPSYPGLDSISRALGEHADLGCTVHQVTEEVDAGEILVSRRCLRGPETVGFAPELAEFLVHVDEQRLVKETLRRWMPDLNHQRR